MTEGPNPDYCQMFINCDLERAGLVAVVARIALGESDGDTVRGPVLDLDVMRNEDWRRGTENPRDFLFFRYYLDIEPAAGAVNAEYVAAIGALLTRLWEQGFGAVAVCDFEDQLPRQGGYPRATPSTPT